MKKILLLSLLALFAPIEANAQIRMRNVEAQLLRESAAMESRGDLDGAEEVLRRLLEENPGSSGGLFALERVVRAKGTVETILPAVDAFLDDQPESSGVRSLKLRVLAETGAHEELRDEAEAWLRRDPGDVVPYREVARVYERAFGSEGALEVLSRGRDIVGDPSAMALEIGDLLAGSNPVGAAEEWALAISGEGAQAATVVRRLEGLTTDQAAATERLLRELGASEEVGRRRAGARIALDLGYEAEADRLARDVAGALEGRARVTFLTDVARRAREEEMVDVAAWAYDELGDDATTPQERRQFDQRIIDVSLAAGDTAAALEAQRRVVASFTPGSVDRRRATAQVIRLEGAASEPERLRALLVEFREEFPGAPELDDLASSVAGALQRRGDPMAAAEVLEGIQGPRSSLERGYLLLAAGDVEDGRSALLLALTGLPPAEATSVIQFAGLLGRVSPEGAQALAAAGVGAHRGEAGTAAAELATATDQLAAAERAPLLAEAARLAADGGASMVAAEIRERLVAEHGDSPEASEATLYLARWYARDQDDVEAAVRLLEELLATRPNAAIAPEARLELERLRG